MPGSQYFGALEQSQQKQVMGMVAEEGALLFETYCNALRQAVGLPRKSAPDRLNDYRTRAPEIWAQLEAAFPDKYAETMKDWRGLEAREAKKISIQRSPYAAELAPDAARASASTAEYTPPSQI